MATPAEDHSLQTIVHRPFADVYDDAADRLAATGFPRGEGAAVVAFAAADLYKCALQADTMAEWMLIDDAPVKWRRISGPPVVVIKTADYTFDAEEDDVVIANSAADRTFTLPPGANRGVGRPYTLKNINTGIATWDGDGAETIDGDPNLQLAERETYTIIWTGTAWESI